MKICNSLFWLSTHICCHIMEDLFSHSGGKVKKNTWSIQAWQYNKEWTLDTILPQTSKCYNLKNIQNHVSLGNIMDRNKGGCPIFRAHLKCHGGEEKGDRAPPTQSTLGEPTKREYLEKPSPLGLHRGSSGFSYRDTLCNLCIGWRT